MMGASLITEFTHELEEKILRMVDDSVAGALLESVDNIKSNLLDIVNTNSFMYVSHHLCAI